MKVFWVTVLLMISATYAGIGMLFHYVLKGDNIDWYSASSWGYILGWPLILGAIAVFVGICTFLSIFIGDKFDSYERNKRLRQIAENKLLYNLLKTGGSYRVMKTVPTAAGTSNSIKAGQVIVLTDSQSVDAKHFWFKKQNDTLTTFAIKRKYVLNDNIRVCNPQESK